MVDLSSSLCNKLPGRVACIYSVTHPIPSLIHSSAGSSAALLPSYSSFRGWSPPGKFCGIHQAFGMKDPPFLMDNHYFYGHVQQHNSYVSLPEGTQPKTQVSTIRKHGEKRQHVQISGFVFNHLSQDVGNVVDPYNHNPQFQQPHHKVEGQPGAAAPWYSPASCRCGPGRRTTRSSPRCRLGATATVYLYRNYIFVWKIISYDSSECMMQCYKQSVYYYILHRLFVPLAEIVQNSCSKHGDMHGYVLVSPNV